MAENDIYRSQGFGQRLTLGRNPALLIVDFVNGFVDPAILGGGNISSAAERTVKVLERWRSGGAPIVFTRIVYADDGSNAGVWCEKVPALKRLTEHAAESQVVDILKPAEGELVIRKTQASAFFATELASILTFWGVDTIAVVGCTTSGCVRASVVDAISHNFRPVVIADCVGDRALGPHEANLFDIGQKYADLIEAADLDRVLSKSR